eukprot:3872197-Prymnesium_polylepis.1
MLLLQLGAGQRSSAAAEGGECAHTRCPWAMRDREPIAVRSHSDRSGACGHPARQLYLGRNRLS